MACHKWVNSSNYLILCLGGRTNLRTSFPIGRRESENILNYDWHIINNESNRNKFRNIYLILYLAIGWILAS